MIPTIVLISFNITKIHVKTWNTIWTLIIVMLCLMYGIIMLQILFSAYLSYDANDFGNNIVYNLA